MGLRAQTAHPLAAAGVRGELKVNATKWQPNKIQDIKEPAELQL
jgi:hypothetical protein